MVENISEVVVATPHQQLALLVSITVLANLGWLDDT
jgi:hypothetical protein